MTRRPAARVVWQHPVNAYAGVTHGGRDAGGGVRFRRQRRAAGDGGLGRRQRGQARRHCRPLQRQDRLAAAVRPRDRSRGEQAAWCASRRQASTRTSSPPGISAGISRPTRVRDLSANELHGKAVNLPARAMKGCNWTGAEMNWNRAPDQYGAIHFHDDDIYDAGWKPDFAFTVPEDLRSGIYAARLRAGRGRGPHPVLRAAEARHGDRRHRLPGADRQLHGLRQRPRAGERRRRRDADRPADRRCSPRISIMAEHRELGGSLYDTHSDGSGVCYSSRLRPILNMRPRYSLLARRQRLGPLAVQRRSRTSSTGWRRRASPTTSSPTRISMPRGMSC